MMIKLINKYSKLLSEYGFPHISCEVKPLYIDDAYGHVNEENRYVNAIYYYSLISKNIKSINVRRSIYLGILGDNPLLNQTIYLILSNLGIHSINLGSIVKSNNIYKSFKLADFLLLIDSNIDLEGSTLDIRSIIGNWPINLIIKDNYLIIKSSSEVLISLISALYVARPLYSIFSNIPLKTYPLIYLNSQDLSDGIYPVNFRSESYEITNSLSEVNGFLIIVDGEGWIELLELIY